MTDEDFDATISPGSTPRSPHPSEGEVDEHTLANPRPARAPDAVQRALERPNIPGVVFGQELGRGGMGVVYRGRQEFLGRDVAIKLLRNPRSDASFRARFEREAKILAGLAHPNIVACYQAGATEEGTCYLVMEFVNGPTLRSKIDRDGPLEVADALRVTSAVAAALQYAYESKIIHRDVKPENVLLSSATGQSSASTTSSFGYRPKLADLGLARPETREKGVESSLHLTVEAAVIGTPSTMSPEQFDSPESVDFRTDIYGLGCVFFHALTGRPAFMQNTLSTLLVAKRASETGPDPRRLRPDLPEPVAALVMSMLAPARELRPQSYGDLIAQCERLLASSRNAAPRPESRASSMKWVAIGIGAALVLGSIAWFATRGDDAPQTAVPDLRLALRPVAPARAGDPVTLSLAEPIATELAHATFEWIQLEGEPRVELVGEGSSATFVAPLAAASYELKFRVRAVVDGREFTSDVSQVSVGLPPAELSVRIDVSARPTERETTTLTLTPSPNSALEPTARVVWTQTDGPRVELQNSGANVSFTAPEASAPYELAFEVEVASDGREALRERTRFTVDARNDAPSAVITAPPNVACGESVALSATVTDPDSLEGLSSSWRVVSPANLALTFDPPDARSTQFVAPEFDSDTVLELALALVDDGQTTLVPVSLRVSADPTTRPLASGESRSWMPVDIEVDPEGWSIFGEIARPTMIPDQTKGFYVAARSSSGGVARALPRGSFEWSAVIEPQGAKSRACGVRFVDAGLNALSFCIVASESGDAKFVRYAATRAVGERWPEPTPAESVTLGPWSAYKRMELAVVWDGARLQLRWRDPERDVWIDLEPIPLSWRPARLECFASFGQLAVHDMSVRAR